MGYTMQELADRLQKIEPYKIYKAGMIESSSSMVNFRGWVKKATPKETETLYTEYIANWLLQSRKLERIAEEPYTLCDSKNKDECYFRHTNHQKIARARKQEPKWATKETIIAQMMYKKSQVMPYPAIGEIIDFQVTFSEGKKYGAIDLVAYNEAKNTIYLLELKSQETQETLLRSIAEIYTYYKAVQKKALIKELGTIHKLKSEKSLKIVPAIIAFENEVVDRNPIKDYQDRIQQPYVYKLLQACGIEVFLVREVDRMAYEYIIEALQ